MFRTSNFGTKVTSAPNSIENFNIMLTSASFKMITCSEVNEVTSMLETKCVGNNFEMLVTVLIVFVTNNLYL